jgi:hypothetical protein
MLFNPINKKQVTIVPILLSHLERYPKMTIQDIYKLIYQAAMGPEHLLKDKKIAYEKLRDEINKLNIHFSQPILEEIDPLDQIVRLNLVPFKENQGNPERLMEAFYQTAVTFKASTENLKTYFTEIILMAEEINLSFKTNEIQTFFRMIQKCNFPPMHHSKRYKKAYQPSYRLVLKKYLDFL